MTKPSSRLRSILRTSFGSMCTVQLTNRGIKVMKGTGDGAYVDNRALAELFELQEEILEEFDEYEAQLKSRWKNTTSNADED